MRVEKSPKSGRRPVFHFAATITATFAFQTEKEIFISVFFLLDCGIYLLTWKGLLLLAFIMGDPYKSCHFENFGRNVFLSGKSISEQTKCSFIRIVILYNEMNEQ